MFVTNPRVQMEEKIQSILHEWEHNPNVNKIEALNQNVSNLSKQQLHELIQIFSGVRHIRDRYNRLEKETDDLKEWKFPKKRTNVFVSTATDEKMISKLTSNQNAAIRLHKDLSHALEVLKDLPVVENNSYPHRGLIITSIPNFGIGINKVLKDKLVAECKSFIPKVEKIGDTLSEVANHASLWEAYRQELKKNITEKQKKNTRKSHDNNVHGKGEQEWSSAKKKKKEKDRKERKHSFKLRPRSNSVPVKHTPIRQTTQHSHHGSQPTEPSSPHLQSTHQSPKMPSRSPQQTTTISSVQQISQMQSQYTAKRSSSVHSSPSTFSPYSSPSSTPKKGTTNLSLSRESLYQKFTTDYPSLNTPKEIANQLSNLSLSQEEIPNEQKSVPEPSQQLKDIERLWNSYPQTSLMKQSFTKSQTNQQFSYQPPFNQKSSGEDASYHLPGDLWGGNDFVSNPQTPINYNNGTQQKV